MHRKLAPAFLLLAMVLVARGAAAVHLTFSTGDGIELRDDWVVITPEEGAKAEISPGGRLRIDGRWVAVSERDRLLLARYNRAIHDIHAQAIEIGIQGAGIGFSALGAAVVGLLTGGGDAAVERHVEPQARRLKEKAKQLCREVQRLRRLQDDLAADVPAFRPYALMDEDDEPRCQMDD
ncbi:MAG TPA: DUF2884 family protein [Thermoanaerobaculia bacterium]|jgi:hypothetical protein|nr:DUF2884 family protein [Thermoanaerobaculia bacterium]